MQNLCSGRRDCVDDGYTSRPAPRTVCFKHFLRDASDPATVQAVIDDIVADMKRRPTAFTPTSGDTSRDATTMPDTPQSEPVVESDTRRDNAEHVADTAATSGDHDDHVAALTKEFEQVKFENLQLKADVKSREQFNEYIKQQFEDVLEQTLDRSQRIGQLESEVSYLRAALPKGEAEPEMLETEADRNPQTY